MEMARHFVRELARRDAARPRRLGHLQPVLVGAGLEQDIAACLTLEPGDDVGRHHLIGMADMWAAIGIVDGGGDVEWIGHGRSLEHPQAQVKPGMKRQRSDHESHSQPPIRSVPPIGVIAPNQRGAPKAMA